MAKVRTLVRKPLAVMVLFALLGVSAHAASILIFTNRSTFEAFVGAPRLAFNFNDLPDGVSEIPDQVSVQGLTISGGRPTIGGGYLNYVYAAGTPLSLHFNFGVDLFAFGIEVAPRNTSRALNISSDDFRVTGVLDAGESFIGFAGSGRGRFDAFNFTITEALGNTNAPSSFVIDNVLGYTIPEPSTLLLMAAGAGLVGLYTRRRKPVAERADAERGAGESDPM